MALHLTINGVDFSKYIVPTTQVVFDDKLNLAKTLSFSVYPADTIFPIVTANQRVRLFDETKVVFTGYVVTTPSKTNVASGFAGYAVTANSDEWLFGSHVFSPAITYVGLPAGLILQNLVALAGGNVDFSNVPQGPIVPQFIVQDGWTFIQAAQALGQKIGWRWYISDGAMFFVPQNDKPYGYDISVNDPTFNLNNLNAIISNVSIVNDLYGQGVQEPTSYVNDNFVGDGTATVFNIFTQPFGVGTSNVLFSDSFSSTILNLDNWSVKDPSSLISYQRRNITISGGTGKVGDTTLYVSDPFELGGELTFDLGTFVFNNLSNGILGGVYSDTSFSNSVCFAGVWATGNTIRTGLQAIINGQPQSTTLVTQPNHSYQLLTHVSADTIYRFRDIFRSITGQFGGDIVKSGGYVTVEILDHDLNNPSVPPTSSILFDSRVAAIPAFGYVGLFNCLSLFASITNGPKVTQLDPVRVRDASGRISKWTVSQNGSVWQIALAKTPSFNDPVFVHYRAVGTIQSHIKNSSNIVKNGIKPAIISLPSSVRSSADCENLLQAYLSDHASSLFEGTYVQNATAIIDVPTAGRYLNINVPSLSGQIFVSIVREAVTSFTNLATEQCNITTTFGFAPLMATFVTSNTAGTTTANDINSLPLFLDDDTGFQTPTIIGTTISADGGKVPSGVFQIRSSDIKWGIDSSDLLATSATQTFLITRTSRADVFFVREVNGSKFSRNSSVLLASGYPIIPAAPTASSITVGLNVTFNLVLGALADVDSVLIAAPDDSVLFSQKVDPVALALQITPQFSFTRINIDWLGIVNQRNYNSYKFFTINFRGERSTTAFISGSLAAPTAPTITVGTINGEVVTFALSTEARNDITQEILEVASDSGFVTIVATDSENAQFGSSTVDVPSTGTYFVRARKADALGFGSNTASPPSFVVSTVSSVDKSTPNPPTTILAPTQAIVKSADGTLAENVTLTWVAPVTIPPAVTGYLIRYKVSTATIYTYNRVGNVTTATLHGLLLNTTYNISVASMGEVSQQSSFPTDINVTTNNNAVAPSATTGLTAIGGFRQVSLKWTSIADSDLAFYQVEWAPDVAGSPGTFQTIARANTNHYDDKGDSTRGQLAVSTTYWYRVSAFNTTANQGTLTSNVSATTTTVGLDADVSDGSSFKRLLNVNVDNTIHVSTSLNPQGSVLPNQAVLLSFAMPSSSTIIATWLQQSLLRPDNTSVTVVASNGVGNLVVNGDFEAAGTVGAQAANWSLAGGNALTKNATPHSGSFAGNINNAGGATSQNTGSSFSVTAGVVYVLEGWVKTDALPSIPTHVGAAIDLNIISGVTSFSIITKFGGWEGQSTTTPRIGLPADGVARGYTFVQCYFTTAASGVVVPNVILQSNSGNGWFDDIKLYPFGGGIWTGLSASTGYYLYPYLDVATSTIKFTNGSPPSTSPSDTFALQGLLDGRQGFVVKKVTTPAAGGSGTDTGGGSGTCPEFNELVWVQRYSDEGELLFDGQIKAGRVSNGYESDDGTRKRGDFLKGYSFKNQKEIYRAVQQFSHVPCAGWVMIDGHRVTPCETVYHEGEWKQAWKAKGATHDAFIGYKVLIQVEADWDDEHNYYVGDLLIHNGIVMGC